MTPKALEQRLRTALQQPWSDGELRAHLEQLAAEEISFSGFTWLYGPELYRRNRLLFRPLILSRFSTYLLRPKQRARNIPWKGAAAPALESWLAEADRLDDVDVFRRLYEWKLASRFTWKLRDERSRALGEEVLTRFRAAQTPAQRQTVLRKLDLWFTLDESTACALYALEPRVAGPFILRHLPSGWLSGAPKRVLWQRLVQLADQRRDEEFRWKLYRRQVPLNDWIRDALAACEQVPDPGLLDQALERHHPEGWGVNLSDGFFQLVQRRGRDLFPYVLRHLRQVWGGWLGRGSYGKMADFARRQGWWDLWSALVRVCSGPKEFNREVGALMDDTALPTADVVLRLRALAGVSREWNWAGFGLAAVHSLDEGVALRMDERFPELLRGPYKLHVQPQVGAQHYPKLLDRWLAAGDEEMIDFLASRLVTRSGRWGNAPKLLAEANRLADYYAALKTDAAAFSRRAARVLGQVPAYAIGQYGQLIRENRLARLLFERSAAEYLAEPRSLADLVEASEIHVMALAYRALGLDDPRAREQARQHLPLLLGTLLRPMQRDTRALAFGALANAAHDPVCAGQILERAREAWLLPDRRYPKEKLLGLIATVLRRWPERRRPAEQAQIHEHAA